MEDHNLPKLPLSNVPSNICHSLVYDDSPEDRINLIFFSFLLVWPLFALHMPNGMRWSEGNRIQSCFNDEIAFVAFGAWQTYGYYMP